MHVERHCLFRKQERKLERSIGERRRRINGEKQQNFCWESIQVEELLVLCFPHSQRSSVPQNIRRGIELSRQCSCDSGMRFARLIGEEKKDFTAEELKVKLLSCRDRSFKADSLALAAMMVVPHDRQLLQHAAFGNSALAIGQIAMEVKAGCYWICLFLC
jgi:hypothetical protein